MRIFSNRKGPQFDVMPTVGIPQEPALDDALTQQTLDITRQSRAALLAQQAAETPTPPQIIRTPGKRASDGSYTPTTLGKVNLIGAAAPKPAPETSRTSSVLAAHLEKMERARAARQVAPAERQDPEMGDLDGAASTGAGPIIAADDTRREPTGFVEPTIINSDEDAANNADAANLDTQVGSHGTDNPDALKHTSEFDANQAANGAPNNIVPADLAPAKPSEEIPVAAQEEPKGDDTAQTAPQEPAAPAPAEPATVTADGKIKGTFAQIDTVLDAQIAAEEAANAGNLNDPQPFKIDQKYQGGVPTATYASHAGLPKLPIVMGAHQSLVDGKMAALPNVTLTIRPNNENIGDVNPQPKNGTPMPSAAANISLQQEIDRIAASAHAMNNTAAAQALADSNAFYDNLAQEHRNAMEQAALHLNGHLSTDNPPPAPAASPETPAIRKKGFLSSAFAKAAVASIAAAGATYGLKYACQAASTACMATGFGWIAAPAIVLASSVGTLTITHFKEKELARQQGKEHTLGQTLTKHWKGAVAGAAVGLIGADVIVDAIKPGLGVIAPFFNEVSTGFSKTVDQAQTLWKNFNFKSMLPGYKEAEPIKIVKSVAAKIQTSFSDARNGTWGPMTVEQPAADHKPAHTPKNIMKPKIAVPAPKLDELNFKLPVDAPEGAKIIHHENGIVEIRTPMPTSNTVTPEDIQHMRTQAPALPDNGLKVVDAPNDLYMKVGEEVTLVGEDGTLSKGWKVATNGMDMPEGVALRVEVGAKIPVADPANEQWTMSKAAAGAMPASN